MLFSQRIGKTPVKVDLQIESMDDDLTNKIWSLLYLDVFDELHVQKSYSLRNCADINFYSTLWLNYFRKPIDEMLMLDKDSFLTDVRNYFFGSPWYKRYDLLEFIIQYWNPSHDRDRFIYNLNSTLEDQLSAYRVVGEEITPITDKVEIMSIETAINDTADQYKNAANHLENALSLYSNREAPDYRNSIKESISAVEAVSAKIAGKKATLGDALERISKTKPIHPALKDGFKKIYGYTNDAHGIRHALSDEPSLSEEDARFMLVACSAFVNYLIVKNEKEATL